MCRFNVPGPIYNILYDSSYDYLKFVVWSTYNSDLQRAKIYLRNIAANLLTLSQTVLRFCK